MSLKDIVQLILPYIETAETVSQKYERLKAEIDEKVRCDLCSRHCFLFDHYYCKECECLTCKLCTRIKKSEGSPTELCDFCKFPIKFYSRSRFD